MLVAFLAGPSTSAEEPPLERVGTVALKGPAGGLDHMAFDAARSRLFVANTSNGSLDIVDVKAGKLVKQVPGQARIRGVDYSPELDRIFVGNGTRGICNVFDAGDYRLLKNLALGADADNVRYNSQSAARASRLSWSWTATRGPLWEACRSLAGSMISGSTSSDGESMPRAVMGKLA